MYSRQHRFSLCECTGSRARSASKCRHENGGDLRWLVRQAYRSGEALRPGRRPDERCLARTDAARANMTHQAPTHCDDVVGVEVTVDGMLAIADRLHLMDFPVALGIRLNIPQVELRDIVWEQVRRDLTAQGVLDLFGEPHPEVTAMVDTLSRADRTLEGRWWRRDVGGKMVRFVVCRNPDRAAHDRPGAAGVGADRDLHRRNRVG